MKNKKKSAIIERAINYGHFWIKWKGRGLAVPTYKTLFIKIEYGVVPKKSTLKFRADFLSLGVFDYADYESDG